MQNKPKDPGLKKSLKGHKDAVMAIDFSPDTSQVVSGSLDATVLVWKLNAKQVPNKFVGHTGAVHSVAFNPTGTLIATGSADHTVRLWENDSRGRSSVLKSHSGAVRACSFSFDGQYLLTGSDDKYLKIFTVHNKRHTSTINAHTNWIRAAEFSPDSRLIVSASEDKTVKLWDSEQLAQISAFEDEANFLSARFHPDGTCIASGTLDGKASVWDIRSQMLLQLYDSAHTDAVNSVAFHNSGRYLLTASNDSTMKIFDLRKGSLLYSLYGHEGTVQVVNFSKDGAIFGSGGSDSNLILWDSNLVDPEQEEEATRLKKAKKDSQNLGKKTKSGAHSAAEKLKRLQKKRKKVVKDKEETKDLEKENDSLSSNQGTTKYEEVAEDLAGMMDKITVQNDIITRTIVALSKRIAENEELVNEAYNQYKVHKRNAEIREQQPHDQEENLESEPREEFKETLDPTQSVVDLEETRNKCKNIMNIINLSQYSLAAVSKSVSEVKETTTQIQKDITMGGETRNFDPIREDSDEELERDPTQVV